MYQKRRNGLDCVCFISVNISENKMLNHDEYVIRISILLLLVNFSDSKMMISDYLSFAQFVISMFFENYVEILLVFQVF